MKRLLFKRLVEWKNSDSRKPLIIQGARQVGKTWIMKEFGKQHYKKTVYINFEEQQEAPRLFEKSLSANYLIEQLSLFAETDISKKATLIIFDEIQACPKALTSLKYFEEQRPDIHIVAAGSLLGVAVNKKSSFPVGKVDFETLYSLSFAEFLLADGNEILVDYLEKESCNKTISSVIHERLLEYYKRYLFVGGMPAAVQSWVAKHDSEEVRKIQDNIIIAYKKDFSKYATPEDAIRIGAIWNTIPMILAKENKKFKYKDISSSARSSTHRTAIDWLEKSGLIFLSLHLKIPKFPLSGYADSATFKIYFHDVGLLAAMLSISSKMILEKEALFSEYNGAFTENFVASELLRSKEDGLFYWTSKSDAEIDFILPVDNEIIPVEVKSGYSRHKKSLQSYDKKYHPDLLIRLSPREFVKSDTFLNIPLYEAGFWRKRICSS